MADQLTDKELQEIDQYLTGASDADEAQVKGWLRRLRAQVHPHAQVDKAPLKAHGDALLDGSGTRHGLHETE